MTAVRKGHPAFDQAPARDMVGELAELAWQVYQKYEKSPRSYPRHLAGRAFLWSCTPTPTPTRR
jgi:hypothetical protein